MNGIEENVPPPQPAPRRLSSQQVSSAAETNGVKNSSETIDEKGEVSLFAFFF